MPLCARLGSGERKREGRRNDELIRQEKEEGTQSDKAAPTAVKRPPHPKNISISLDEDVFSGQKLQPVSSLVSIWWLSINDSTDRLFNLFRLDH